MQATCSPKTGPADWIVDEREFRRSEACEAAHALAELLLARGEALSATVACERGLRIDRYEDSLWRICVSAYERAGDTAAAERTGNLASLVAQHSPAKAERAGQVFG